MSNLERYLEAASRENTQRSYAAGTRHFEEAWGGHLPATTESVARYVADYGNSLSHNTLRSRLAALSRWHVDHGFSDPTQDPLVKRVLKGVRSVHGAIEKKAAPLQIEQLTAVVERLSALEIRARSDGDRAHELTHMRDQALLLLGFWRAFRGDELIRLQAEHLSIVAGEGMTLYLRRSKGDREIAGVTYRVPALSRLCPVQALERWLTASSISTGAVFRKVSRWGAVSDSGFHPNSLIALLRRILLIGGVANPDVFTTHSLRRGLAGWANSNGWDVKTLMEYVGWKDMRSAIGYIDSEDPFAKSRIEKGLSS